MSVGIVHLHVQQFLACLAQSWCLGVVLDVSVLQVVEPFFEWSLSHLVELIDAYDEVFGKHLLGCFHLEGVFLSHAHAQRVLCMHAHEGVRSVIQVVGSLSEVEVDDADGIDLLHLTVGSSQRDVLRYRLCHSVEDALQVVQLPGELHLYYDDLSLGVLGFDVHAVELVVLCFLIAFALQYFLYFNGLAQQHGDESFQYSKVGLVAQHALHCPVETDVFVVCVHCLSE